MEAGLGLLVVIATVTIIGAITSIHFYKKGNKWWVQANQLHKDAQEIKKRAEVRYFCRGCLKEVNPEHAHLDPFFVSEHKKCKGGFYMFPLINMGDIILDKKGNQQIFSIRNAEKSGFDVTIKIEIVKGG